MSSFWYKLKSEKNFKECRIELPLFVSQVRENLKNILNIGDEMDILISLSNAKGFVSNKHLSDYDIINNGMYINAIRLPIESASLVMKEVNEKVHTKKDESNIKDISSDIKKKIQSHENITFNNSSDIFLPSNNFKSDDHQTNNSKNNKLEINKVEKEDAAILSVMQQHGEKFKLSDSQRIDMLEKYNSKLNTSRNTFSSRSEPYLKKTLVNSMVNNSYNNTNLNSSQNISNSFDVSNDYICHMCGERGHHIRSCPKVSEGMTQKKIRPATGIPRSFLRLINFDDESKLYSEIYCLPDGTFAVLKDAKQLSSTAHLTRTVEETINKTMGKSKSTETVRTSLTCPICMRLFRYAVLTPCCGETYCQECIISYIRSNPAIKTDNKANMIIGHCPQCSNIINIADLEPNLPIRTSVNVALGLQQS